MAARRRADRRCEHRAESATSSTYTLTAEDEGKVIQCQVTAANEVAGGDGDRRQRGRRRRRPYPSPAPPLPGAAVQGQLFVGEPECSPCTEANHDAEDGKLFRLFLQVAGPERRA